VSPVSPVEFPFEGKTETGDTQKVLLGSLPRNEFVVLEFLVLEFLVLEFLVLVAAPKQCAPHGIGSCSASTTATNTPNYPSRVTRPRPHATPKGFTWL
jgi:hypothetical protein